VLDSHRGEQSITDLCSKEGINHNLYYKRLAGDTAREATSEEVESLRAESSQHQGDANQYSVQKKMIGNIDFRMRYGGLNLKA
jgi:hypothetical protein